MKTKIKKNIIPILASIVIYFLTILLQIFVLGISDIFIVLPISLGLGSVVACKTLVPSTNWLHASLGGCLTGSIAFLGFLILFP